MKKIISLVLACIILSVLGISALALDANIKYADKTPIETPNFKPTIDGKKDAGYTKEYIVNKSETDGKVAHAGGSKLSTAYYGNTLYFYIEVPDATPQDEIGGLNNYQRDGVWFMLFFKGDIETDNMEDCRWTKYKQSKYFKIYPKVEQLNVEGPCYESQAEPPSEDDFEYKVVYGESGYVIELAYTVPAATATLAAGSEIAFDIEVYDVNDPNATYRYYLANGYEPFTEGYATALGAKLVLAEASSVNTGDLTAVMVLIGSVAVVGTALVIRKKH